MCEQRAVWWWFHPESDYTLVVDHLNCDRSDNRIENLEAVTMEENVRRIKERGRLHPCRGEKSGKTNLSNREAAAIRYMAQEGYPRKDIARMLVGDKAKNPTVTVNRIIEGTRFADIDPYDLWSVYPIIVAATARTDMPMAEQIKNAAMGLTGECGEVVDHLKKVLYQGHEADRDALIEEIGDVLFYLTWLSVLCLGLDRAEIMLRNADKLYKRYPHGFDADRSRNRED